MRIKNAPLVQNDMHQGGIFMKPADQNRLICGRNKLFPYFLQARARGGGAYPKRFADLCARTALHAHEQQLLLLYAQSMNGKPCFQRLKLPVRGRDLNKIIQRQCFKQARGASVPVRAHVFSDPVYKRAAVSYAVCARQPCPKLQKALLGQIFRILNGKILPEKAKYFFVIFLIDLAEQRGDILLFHSLKKRFISAGGRHGLHDPQRAPAAFYGLTGGKKQLSAFQQGGRYIQLKR